MSFALMPSARQAATAASAFATTCGASPPNAPGSSATSAITRSRPRSISTS